MDEIQKAELEKLLAAKFEEYMAAEDKPSKLLEFVFCRRTLSVLGVISVVVAKHFGLNINSEELIAIGVAVGGLVLSHGNRRPGG
jgi:hypothetical protein